jgi:hypothetical protein
MSPAGCLSVGSVPPPNRPSQSILRVMGGILTAVKSGFNEEANMRLLRSLTVALAIVLVLPGLAFPQDFEGVIRDRTVELDDEVLYDLLWADAEEEPEFESEVEWLRYTAELLFQIPMERILANANGDEAETTMWVKGNKVRLADSRAGSGGSYALFDIETMTATMVMPGTRSYIQYTPEEVETATREMMASMGIDPDEVAAMEDYEFEYGDDMEGGINLDPTVRPLNRTDEVNGLQASAFQAEAGQEIGLGWCTEDFTGMRAAMARMAAQMDELDADEVSDGGPSVEDLLCEDALPVRVQVLIFDAMVGGLRYSVNETLSVERTSVDDGLFAIPEGYTQMSLSEMWR